MSFIWVEEPYCTVGDNKCNTFFCLIMHPPNTQGDFWEHLTLWIAILICLFCNQITQTCFMVPFFFGWFSLNFQRKTEPLSTDLQCFLFLLVDKFSPNFNLKNFRFLRIFHENWPKFSRTQDEKCPKQHTFTIGSSR